MTETDLKKFALLADFSVADCEILAELIEPKRVARGRRIFGEGSEADSLVLVTAGNVRVESRRSGASGVLGEGTALGALSLVVLGVREATATAETDCELLMMPRASFRRLVEDHPRTACRFLEALVADVAGLVRQGLEPLAR